MIRIGHLRKNNTQLRKHYKKILQNYIKQLDVISYKLASITGLGNVKTVFHANVGHYPYLYCLYTKRNDNQEEDLKLWTSPSKNALQLHWLLIIIN